jgi:hypothetical protein
MLTILVGLLGSSIHANGIHYAINWMGLTFILEHLQVISTVIFDFQALLAVVVAFLSRIIGIHQMELIWGIKSIDVSQGQACWAWTCHQSKHPRRYQIIERGCPLMGFLGLDT